MRLYRLFSLSTILLMTILLLLQIPTQAQVAPETGTIAISNFHLRYRIEGKGTPTIVIGSSIYYPRVFSQNLRKHLRFVFLDHRGFAPSPGKMDTTAFALDTLLYDIEYTRRELELGRIAIIGHSGHAFMALEYAKKYPENVSHVIMIGIAPDFSAASTAALEQYWQDSVDPERKAILEENVVRLPNDQLAEMLPGKAFIQGYIRNGPRIWYDPSFDSSPLWEGVEINMDMFNHVWGRIFRDIDIAEGLDTFERPVFMALGRYDNIVAPPSTWNSIRPMFRDLVVRVFEKSGHTPQYEQPILFDEELLQWMEQHQ